MPSLREVVNAGQRLLLGNANLTRGVLAINAATAATVKTTSALNYVIDGIFYNASALSAQSIAVTHDAFGAAVGGQNLPAYVQPAGTTAYYLLSINAAGQISVAQGSYAGQPLAYPDRQRVLTGTGDVPREPAGFVAFGLIKVTTGGSATFNPGTTALDAAGITVTYFDLEYVPSANP